MQRVFAIDVLLCASCGGRMKVIAEITDKRVARKMLEHVGWLEDEQRAPNDDDNSATASDVE